MVRSWTAESILIGRIVDPTFREPFQMARVAIQERQQFSGRRLNCVQETDLTRAIRSAPDWLASSVEKSDGRRTTCMSGTFCRMLSTIDSLACPPGPRTKTRGRIALTKVLASLKCLVGNTSYPDCVNNAFR